MKKKLLALMVIMSLVLGSTAVVYANNDTAQGDAGIDFIFRGENIVLPPPPCCDDGDCDECDEDDEILYWARKVGGDSLFFGDHLFATLDATVFSSLDAENLTYVNGDWAASDAANTAGVLVDARAGFDLMISINGFTVDGTDTLEGFTLDMNEFALYGRLPGGAGAANAIVSDATISAANNGDFGAPARLVRTTGLTSLAAGFEGVLDIVSIDNIQDMGFASADLMWVLIAAP